MASPPEGPGKRRPLGGGPAAVEAALCVILAVLGVLWSLELQYAIGLAIFKEQFLGLFLAVGLAAVFLGIKASPREMPRRTPPWYDWVLAAASLAVGGYVAVRFPMMVRDLGAVSADRWILGTIAVLLVLEATRRALGWSLVLIGAGFVFYARFSGYFPGLLNVPGSGWPRLAAYLYLDRNGLLGLPLDVTATIIVGFILFGRLLYGVQGDRFLTQFALASMGRYRGGAAKVAVIASGLFGTASGSAVSNVAMNGPMTIPMMVRTGYPPHVAAAIEAVSSSGGQIMPPVMGITAFLIAEYLAIPYSDVVIAAAVPAILYYVAVFVQIDLEAGKLGLVGLPADQIPRFRDFIGRGWSFAVPIAILMWTLLVDNWQAGKAAFLAGAATLLIGSLDPRTRPTPGTVLRCVIETGRTIVELVVVTAVAGLVIGALQISGLASNFSLLLVTVSGGSLFVLLVVTAAVCTVLGMGMPTAIIYMMLAVLVAPALGEFGVVPIAAHLFLFYFGTMSMLTPPVCLATYAAAAIAQTDFWRAGWEGMRLAVVAYIVPFVLVYQPALVMKGSVVEIVFGVATAVAGVIVLCMGMAGFMYRRLNRAERAAFLTFGLLLFVTPASGVLGYGLNALGACAALTLVLRLRRGRAIPVEATPRHGATG